MPKDVPDITVGIDEESLDIFKKGLAEAIKSIDSSPLFSNFMRLQKKLEDYKEPFHMRAADYIAEKLTIIIYYLLRIILMPVVGIIKGIYWAFSDAIGYLRGE